MQSSWLPAAWHQHSNRGRWQNWRKWWSGEPDKASTEDISQLIITNPCQYTKLLVPKGSLTSLLLLYTFYLGCALVYEQLFVLFDQLTMTFEAKSDMSFGEKEIICSLEGQEKFNLVWRILRLRNILTTTYTAGLSVRARDQGIPLVSMSLSAGYFKTKPLESKNTSQQNFVPQLLFNFPAYLKN